MVNTSLYNTFFSKSSQKGGVRSTTVTSSLNGSQITSIFNKKKGLLVATLANLIFQLGLTYYVMQKYTIKDKNELESSRKKIWLYFLVQLAIIIILTVIPLPSFIKFILFVIFSYTFGLELALMKYFSGEDIIKFALLGTVSIFAIMFAIGTFLILTGINLGYKYGLILFYALLVLILVRLVTLFTGALSGFSKFLSIIGILLFSVYIIYDTNVILQRNYYGDFITASMDYYLDIINIFLNLLSFNNN
jgi:FtsH-binding integral membrane protein